MARLGKLKGHNAWVKIMLHGGLLNYMGAFDKGFFYFGLLMLVGGLLVRIAVNVAPFLLVMPSSTSRLGGMMLLMMGWKCDRSLDTNLV